MLLPRWYAVDSYRRGFVYLPRFKKEVGYMVPKAMLVEKNRESLNAWPDG